MNDKQFGFRSQHSTYMAILEFIDKISNAVENNETTIGIFLDLSKAFDTIDHNILVHKLENYGFRGNVLEWFKDYLMNRKQYVYYNSCKSNYESITCGVPQGSILGPLLFILYVNDILNTSTILEFVLFADDTTITYSHNNIVSKIDLINNELREVNNWFRANKLSVNSSKTNYMVLGTKQNTSRVLKNVEKHIILDNSILETKFLGVTIDENLTWKTHIDNISKNISKGIGVINHIKHFVPNEVLYSLYCTLVLPYINYGVLAWGNTSKSHLEKVFKLQKKALRIISNSPYLCHSAPIFKNYNVLNVYDTYNLELSTFMYKHFYDQLPKAFNNYFIRQPTDHRYHTRNTNDYKICLTKTKFVSKTMRFAGPRNWNTINKDTKMAKSVKHFRSQMKANLINTYI